MRARLQRALEVAHHRHARDLRAAPAAVLVAPVMNGVKAATG
jgi:hypothetical protein